MLPPFLLVLRQRRTVEHAATHAATAAGRASIRARLKGRMQASSARSGQRHGQREPGPGALARARDSVTDSSASKGRGHRRNSGERYFCGRPGEEYMCTCSRTYRPSTLSVEFTLPVVQGPQNTKTQNTAHREQGQNTIKHKTHTHPAAGEAKTRKHKVPKHRGGANR